LALATRRVTVAKAEVATVKDSAPALASDQLPAYLQGQIAAQGSDNFDSSDVVVPRIKLLQGLSPELQTFNEAKMGLFWHTGLDMPLGNEFRFVIADRRKKYLLTAPIEDGQGLLARADDAHTWDRTGRWQVKIKGTKQPVIWEIATKDVAKSGLTGWGTYNPDDSDSPPAATLFYDYLVFLPDRLELGPAVVSLARSAIKTAKRGLNDKISLHQSNGRPMQALVFTAQSVDDSSDGQSFKNWLFKAAGFVQDKALYDLAVEHAGALSHTNLRVQDETEGAQNTRVTDDGQGNF
jgi:hypothetical protein